MPEMRKSNPLPKRFLATFTSESAQFFKL